MMHITQNSVTNNMSLKKSMKMKREIAFGKVKLPVIQAGRGGMAQLWVAPLIL